VHQTGYTVFTARNTPKSQFPVYSRASVGLIALLVYRFDLHKQPPIVPTTLTLSPFAPYIIAASGDFKQSAHGRNGKRVPMLFDKLVS